MFRIAVSAIGVALAAATAATGAQVQTGTLEDFGGPQPGTSTYYANFDEVVPFGPFSSYVADIPVPTTLPSGGFDFLVVFKTQGQILNTWTEQQWFVDDEEWVSYNYAPYFNDWYGSYGLIEEEWTGDKIADNGHVDRFYIDGTAFSSYTTDTSVENGEDPGIPIGTIVSYEDTYSTVPVDLAYSVSISGTPNETWSLTVYPFSPTPVPEISTWWALFTGVAIVGASFRQRRSLARQSSNHHVDHLAPVSS